ncbi:MAG: tRNA (adenosine(37)-N6)-threonylcarbamoyltransferase complex ATPase subunit type 1 TsaE [Deltaproteobacteria bacterium]|jgi:tRNA threonylcarbamoyl adenosine modification protein YjeE|nr:tRNA (adenosine(37)-N6)-threonylcarbamoyltransferase complex ATPase subunit type 1 TsaE [Deltaproteobacteria bacterium]
MPIPTAATAEETQAFGAFLGLQGARWCEVHRSGLLIGLSGDLGAGKTTLVQGLVAALPGGSSGMATSPTYALVHHYPTQPPVTHLDLYRLGSSEALDSIGYRELSAGPGLTVVEWIDQIPDAVPPVFIEIHLAVTRSDVREFRVRAHGPALAALGQILESWNGGG